jgi:hypothetical protein
VLKNLSSAVMRVLVVSLPLLGTAHAQLPKRDLTVELRQVEEGP